MTSRWVRACVTVAAAVLVLAGCGDDDPDTTAADPGSGSSESTSEPASEPTESESTPAETPSEDPTSSEPAAPLPPCTDIWVDDGRKLPAPYLGCSDGGTDVPADARSCSFGKPLVIYGDRFYAVPRGPINETAGPLAKDRDYRGALASCTA